MHDLYRIGVHLREHEPAFYILYTKFYNEKRFMMMEPDYRFPISAVKVWRWVWRHNIKVFAPDRHTDKQTQREWDLYGWFYLILFRLVIHVSWIQYQHTKQHANIKRVKTVVTCLNQTDNHNHIWGKNKCTGQIYYVSSKKSPIWLYVRLEINTASWCWMNCCKCPKKSIN